jgi:outer membrane protein assembly factor BamB
MPTEFKNSQWGSDRMWNRIALVAGVFALLICVLLVANYIQIKKSDPVNMTVINSLVERLYANPADSLLRKDIRTLDLLSRKAYFTSQWQIRTGGYLLLVLIATMVISMQVVEYRRKINPVISSEPQDESMLQRRKARKWIVMGGSILLLIAVIFAVLASNNLTEKFKVLGKGEVAGSEELPASMQTGSVADTMGIISDSAGTKDTTTTPVVLASTDNFPNFRGNAGNASKRNVPVSWDGITGSNVVWKTALPLPGQNSPIVWGDRIFVTGASAGKQEV